MKTQSKFNRVLARAILSLGNQIYSKHPEKMNWEEHANIAHWYTPKYGHMGSRNDLYFQFEVDHDQKDERGFSKRIALKYFRYSPESKDGKGWSSKLFDINIGASAYVGCYDKRFYGKKNEREYSKKENYVFSWINNRTILIYERFWFTFKIVPIILLGRWIVEMARKTKLGRNIWWINRMCTEFGYSIRTLYMCACKHPNMEYDSSINGDSGQEWISCPDCGYHQHIVYY